MLFQGGGASTQWGAARRVSRAYSKAASPSRHSRLFWWCLVKMHLGPQVEAMWEGTTLSSCSPLQSFDTVPRGGGGVVSAIRNSWNWTSTCSRRLNPRHREMRRLRNRALRNRASRAVLQNSSKADKIYFFGPGNEGKGWV